MVFLLGLLFLTSGGDSGAASSNTPVTAGAASETAASQDNALPIAGGTIENYVGQNIDEIRTSIFNTVGGNLAVITEPSAEPAGTILLQNLEPGTQVESDTALTLTVSDGSGSP